MLWPHSWFIFVKTPVKRNGLKLILKPLPGLRALVDADRGKTDGDAHRVYGIIEKKGLHNLIRIPEIQQVVHDYAWAKKDSTLVPKVAEALQAMKRMELIKD